MKSTILLSALKNCREGRFSSIGPMVISVLPCFSAEWTILYLNNSASRSKTSNWLDTWRNCCRFSESGPNPWKFSCLGVNLSHGMNPEPGPIFFLTSWDINSTSMRTSSNPLAGTGSGKRDVLLRLAFAAFQDCSLLLQSIHLLPRMKRLPPFSSNQAPPRLQLNFELRSCPTMKSFRRTICSDTVGSNSLKGSFGLTTKPAFLADSVVSEFI